MMKKSPARSLSKGLSKAGLGMRKSTAAARTMGKPSQRTPKETLLNAYNQAAQRQAQKPKGLPGLTALSTKLTKAPTQKPNSSPGLSLPRKLVKATKNAYAGALTKKRKI